MRNVNSAVVGREREGNQAMRCALMEPTWRLS
jgi:hypothetical protein